MVQLQEWERRIAGLRTQSRTREFCCRACGAKILLYPRPEIRALKIMAYVFLPAIFPSIMFFAKARRKERPWIENPVVVGAIPAGQDGPRAPVMPLDESGIPLPNRRCTCGASARCVRIALQGSWDRQLGATFHYRCEHCGDGFNISSPGHLAVLAVLGAVLAAFGALIILVPPGSGVGAAESNRVCGVPIAAIGTVLLAVMLWRTRARWRHPRVP